MFKPLKALCVALPLAVASFAALADYPERPLRLYVATAPGGTADIVARLIAKEVQESFGQPVLVENRTGGVAGSIATSALLAQPADGYTAVYQTTAMTILPWLTDKLTFNPERDLVPVIRTGTSPYVFVVRASFPGKTFNDFIAHARANPGKLSCSTIGVGSAPHLALELLQREAGIDILHVPYRGFALAFPDLQSGRIDCSVEAPVIVQAHVSAGTLRALAITSRDAPRDMPGAFPVATRYPSVDVAGWGGFFVSAKTPQPIIEKMHTAFRKALENPQLAAKLRESGLQSEPQSIVEFQRIIDADRQRYGSIVKARNIKLQE